MVGSHLSQGPVKLEIICDWEKYGKIWKNPSTWAVSLDSIFQLGKWLGCFK